MLPSLELIVFSAPEWADGYKPRGVIASIAPLGSEAMMSPPYRGGRT